MPKKRPAVSDRIAIRIDDKLRPRLLGYWMGLRGELPGVSVSLSDAVRGLVEAGLERVDEKRFAEARDGTGRYRG